MRADELREMHSLVRQEKWPAAWELGNKLLNEEPERPDVLFLMGCTLRAIGNVGLALPVISKALSKEHKQPNLWMNYGSTLHDLHRWSEAHDAFMVVHGMLPNDPMPIANIGAGHVQQGHWLEAEEWCNRALAIDPENHIAHISAAFACLALGKWLEAWAHNKWLYAEHMQVRIYNPPEREEPEWDGSPGKTVVVSCDQGLGDVIMFSQCLPQLVRDCKQVIVECHPKIEALLRRTFPDVTVYGTLKELTLEWPKEYQIDARIHLSYLGKFYRNEDADFPRKAYLTPEPALLAKWKEWLRQYPYPRVGLAWQGGIQQTMKHLRSIELADYGPIMKTGGSFFDLSYHKSSAEVAHWNIRLGPQVIKPDLDLADYEDTVAFLAALDEVVCVTTTVAHVCGALGRSARVLVSEVPTWRYSYECADGGMVWYPKDSVKLYRWKAEDSGWPGVVERVAADIRRQKVLRAA